MGFKDVAALYRYPKGVSERYQRLDSLQRLLDGTIYDPLPYPFEKEEDGSQYIPLKRRRPSVIYNLPKIIVDHTSALTFGEAHAPNVRVDSPTEVYDVEGDDRDDRAQQHNQFEKIIEAVELDAVMLEAMQSGSVGSVALVLRQLPDRMPWVDVIDSKYCTPTFEIDDPRKLEKMEQVYSTTLVELELAGYDVTSYKKELEPYWIRIVYTKKAELWSAPLPQKRFERLGMADPDVPGQVIEWVPDKERSSTNPFSFINVLWIRNFEERRKIDAASTFGAISDVTIEISYLLSQIGRGYRYTADPLLAIESGDLNSLSTTGGFSSGEGQSSMVRSAARTIDIPAGGQVKMLEITGTGLHNAGEHVRLLREYAFEVVSGMKADQQHATGVHSGKALHYLHQALVWLVERFRVSYGQRGFLMILKMVMEGLREGVLDIPGVDPGALPYGSPLRLVWAPWSAPTGTDLQAELTALQLAAGGGPNDPLPLLPQDVITQKAAAAFGISDANRMAAEMRAMGDHQAQRAALLLSMKQSEINKNNATAAKANEPESSSGSSESD
jgi:hypothetical protein